MTGRFCCCDQVKPSASFAAAMSAAAIFNANSVVLANYG
jgi:hypothetical protein